jgi:serine/threonine protein kinase/predicted solute-binding protein
MSGRARLRVGWVGYANTLPLRPALDGLTGPDGGGGVELFEGVPTRINAMLAAGEVDVAPVSSIEAARHADDWVLLPGVSISCDGPARSVLVASPSPLLSPCELPLPVHLTPASATSAVLLDVLARYAWRDRGGPGWRGLELVDGEPEAGCARLLIGDEALREEVACAYAHHTDLGLAWFQHTGLPMVFALFCARRRALAEGHGPALDALNRSLAGCAAHPDVEAAAATGAGSLALPRAAVATYLAGLSYGWTARHRAGFDAFLDLARRAGHLPETARGGAGEALDERGARAAAPSRRAARPAVNRIGQVYGDYEIREMLGAGGMGEVFRARQVSLDRPVAVKFISAERYADDVNRRRFLREIRTCSTLSHPNVVKIYDWGEKDGDIFLVMEYLDGVPLETYIHKAPGGLPVDFVLKVTEDVLAALAHMHPLGFIHRDIKPANVMVGRYNRAVLMDFGLVKVIKDYRLTQTGKVLGTPRYLPPEALLGESGDHRADLYQVGLVLCEALLGKIPFKQRELLEYLKGERSEAPRMPRDVRPDLDPGVAQLVANALEHDPDARYQEAREMLSDLARLRDGKPIASTRDLERSAFPRVFPELRLSAAFRERYAFLSFVTRDPVLAVVCAHDTKRDRRVHLRFVAPAVVRSAPRRDALAKALETLAAIDHPGVSVPSVVGREDDMVYVTYPVNRDATLQECLDARPRFAPETVVGCGIQLTAALSALHAHGLVHGFLAPASVRVSPDGVLSISDAELGILARHTALAESRDFAASLGYYTSPEQLDGAPPTPASDAYALAALLYRMSAGAHPMPGHELAEDRTDPVRSLLLPALAPEPGKRAADLAAFAAGLERHSRGGRGRSLAADLLPPEAARPRRPTAPVRRPLSRSQIASPPGRAGLEARRRPVLAVLAVLVALAVAVVVVSRLAMLVGPASAEVRDLAIRFDAGRATLEWSTTAPVPTRVEIGTDPSRMEVLEAPGRVPVRVHRLVTHPLPAGTGHVLRILLPGGASHERRFRTPAR